MNASVRQSRPVGPAARQVLPTLILLAMESTATAGPTAEPAVTYVGDVRSVLERYCVDCHGWWFPKGGLRLDSRAGRRALGPCHRPGRSGHGLAHAHAPPGERQAAEDAARRRAAAGRGGTAHPAVDRTGRELVAAAGLGAHSDQNSPRAAPSITSRMVRRTLRASALRSGGNSLAPWMRKSMFRVYSQSFPCLSSTRLMVQGMKAE